MFEAAIATRHRATATVTVHDNQAQPFDTSAGPELVEISIRETFEGEMSGESVVRALQTKHADGTATQTSLQRVRGSLDGREGTYVLEGRGEVAGGKVSATWCVVPGSGTGRLSGLCGEGGFEGRFGQGSAAWLDYWFEE